MTIDWEDFNRKRDEVVEELEEFWDGNVFILDANDRAWTSEEAADVLMEIFFHKKKDRVEKFIDALMGVFHSEEKAP